jgi:hypothetical protein
MKFNFQTIFNDRRIGVKVNGVRLNLLARDIVNCIDDPYLLNLVLVEMAEFDAKRVSTTIKNKLNGVSLYKDLPNSHIKLLTTEDDYSHIELKLNY